MFDRTRLSRLITLALASCAVTWAFAAGAFARPDANTGVAPSAEVAPNPAVAPPPVYKVVPGDTDKVPSASTAPAYQPAIGDSLKAPDRAAVDRNLASLSHGGKAGPRVVSAGSDHTDTIALITAIAAMLVALAAVTFIVVRPQQGPVLRA